MQQGYPVIIKPSQRGFVALVPDFSLMIPSSIHDSERFIALVKDTMFTLIKALTEDSCDIPPPTNWFDYLNKVTPPELCYLLIPQEDATKYEMPDVPLIKKQLRHIRMKKFGKIPDAIYNGYIYPDEQLNPTEKPSPLTDLT